LSGIVHQYGQVSREVALQKQRESQILLFLDWDDSKEKGVIAGKIFEYMATGRPILSVGGSDDNAVTGILEDTNSGIQATTIVGITDALEDYYIQYHSQGRVARCGNESSVKKYSQREMARQFSETLAILSYKTKGG